MPSPRSIGTRSGTFPSGSFREAPSLSYRVEGDLAPVLVVELQPDEHIWFDHRRALWKNGPMLAPHQGQAPFRDRGSERIYVAKTDAPGTIALWSGRPGVIAALQLEAGEHVEVRASTFLAASSGVRFSGSPFLVGNHTAETLLAADAPGIVWLAAHGDPFELVAAEGEEFDVDPAQWLYSRDRARDRVSIREHLPVSNLSVIWLRVSGPSSVGFQTG
jgi:uncharacterized protein (AIM24 family)